MPTEADAPRSSSVASTSLDWNRMSPFSCTTTSKLSRSVRWYWSVTSRHSIAKRRFGASPSSWVRTLLASSRNRSDQNGYTAPFGSAGLGMDQLRYAVLFPMKLACPLVLTKMLVGEGRSS